MLLFEHPVALANDLISRAALKVHLLGVLVDSWYATL
jgi:hypothetical protein